MLALFSKHVAELQSPWCLACCQSRLSTLWRHYHARSARREEGGGLGASNEKIQAQVHSGQVRSPQVGGQVRSLMAAEGELQLAQWLETNEALPPVRLMGLAPPTALSWLRRRGPEVHHGLLFKLFRQRMIRVFRPKAGVSRVSRGRLLDEGDVILFPRGVLGYGGMMRHDGEQPGVASRSTAALAAQSSSARKQLFAENGAPAYSAPAYSAASSRWQSVPASSAVSSRSPPVPAGSLRPTVHPVYSSKSRSAPAASSRSTPAFSPLGVAGAGRSPAAAPAAAAKDVILRWTDDILFVNKPAGMDVQGPSGNSLEALMAGPLRLSPSDDLKLVHRLDRPVSGVMMVARNADAAAWLAACLRHKASLALQGLEEERVQARARLKLPPTPPPRPLPPADDVAPADSSLSRVYWALLHGELRPGDRGRITLPVPLPGGRGPARPAVTTYRVRASREGLSWVELTPLTGRRHQLRYHCWKGLKAPIVGDAAYGFKGLQLPASGSGLLPRADPWWSSYGVGGSGADGEVPVLLHSRQLVVQPPKCGGLKVVAPVPGYMSGVMEALGWDAS